MSVSCAVESNIAGEPWPKVRVGVVKPVQPLPGAALEVQKVKLSWTVALMTMSLAVDRAAPPKSTKLPGLVGFAHVLVAP